MTILSVRVLKNVVNRTRMSGEKVGLLATYGTLRDDDDSGAAWTKTFILNISGAQTGRVSGYQLFGHPRTRYPFALHTGNVNDSIVVRALSWPTQEEFDRKIIEADVIEGDDYDRRVVEVELDDQSRQPAYIYVSKATRLDEQWKPIRNGNWLERDPFLSV